MIAAVNLGKTNTDPKEREARLKRWETQLHPVRGATAVELFAEAERHAKDWDYVQWAEALRRGSVFLLKPTIKTMPIWKLWLLHSDRKAPSGSKKVAVTTDHSFSDRRIELQSIVIKWLETMKK